MPKTRKIDNAQQFVAENGRDFIRKFSDDIPLIIPALLAAEDHRGASHKGIDYRSLARALRKSIFSFKYRFSGISTIEQQIARIIYPRAGRNLFWCKINELILSHQLNERISKLAIWCAYLNVAYYGTGLHDYRSVRKSICGDGALTELRAATIVSCLKFPKPKNPTDQWKARHKDRVAYVISRREKFELW